MARSGLILFVVDCELGALHQDFIFSFRRYRWLTLGPFASCPSKNAEFQLALWEGSLMDWLGQENIARHGDFIRFCGWV